MNRQLILLFCIVIGISIACKKTTPDIRKLYSDKELNVNPKSTFAEEERKIKQNIMESNLIDISSKKEIIEGLVMENDHPKSIINGMSVFNKLSVKQQIGLLKILLPISNITIHDNLSNADTYTYRYEDVTTLNSPRCWTTIKNSSQSYGCPEQGNDVCFKYNPGC